MVFLDFQEVYGGMTQTTKCKHAGRRDRNEFLDEAFCSESYYYVRVTQFDKDEHGNPSRAWSSPIWVTSGR